MLSLEEANSPLDTVSDRLVQQAIDELSRDRTSLVIAHRLSTVQQADQIAVMEKGRVVELGTHKALLAADGTYSKLCSLQFDHVKENKESEETLEIAKISYECRANLNTMTGLLAILNDNVETKDSENVEIIDDIFGSLQNVLTGLEKIEKQQTSN